VEDQEGIEIPVEMEGTDGKEEGIQGRDPGEQIKVMGQYGSLGMAIVENLRTRIQQQIHSDG